MIASLDFGFLWISRGVAWRSPQQILGIFRWTHARVSHQSADRITKACCYCSQDFCWPWVVRSHHQSKELYQLSSSWNPCSFQQIQHYHHHHAHHVLTSTSVRFDDREKWTGTFCSVLTYNDGRIADPADLLSCLIAAGCCQLCPSRFAFLFRSGRGLACCSLNEARLSPPENWAQESSYELKCHNDFLANTFFNYISLINSSS